MTYSASLKALPKMIFRVDVPMILWYMPSQWCLEPSKEARFSFDNRLGKTRFWFRRLLHYLSFLVFSGS